MTIVGPKDSQESQKNSQKTQIQSKGQCAKEFIENTIDFYQGLLQVYSSKEHLIVGREKEERKMREYLQTYIDKSKSSILYICGHPGQGKTAVLDQVLSDYFERDDLVIFKYNAMSYSSLSIFLDKFA